jgi:hypothetical protein
MLGVVAQESTRGGFKGVEHNRLEVQIPESRLFAAQRLHQYLTTHHFHGRALKGLDFSGPLNYRIGRFIKSYFFGAAGKDNSVSCQAQGYWILGNWQLYLVTGDKRYRDIATGCSEYLWSYQNKDGDWVYPGPKPCCRGKTVEGTWGSLGLLESYRQTGDSRFLTGARKWYRFLVCEIGFQRIGAELSANISTGRKGPRIVSVSTLVLRFLAELAFTSRQEDYLRLSRGLLRFVCEAQSASGEFQYSMKGESGGHDRFHFKCCENNAFECLDLTRFYELTGETRALVLVRKVLGFLRMGLSEEGRAQFECGDGHREVNSHTAVLAQTFARAQELDIKGFETAASKAYRHLMEKQREDGGFDFSQRDSFFLKDKSSYPRNLAMILHRLLPIPPKQMHHRFRSFQTFSA